MNKKNIIVLITIIVSVLIISIGVTYAYFSANLIGGEEETTITVIGGSMKIIYDGGSNINIKNIIPSDNPATIKTFTVTGNNTTEIEMYYQIILVVEENTFSNNALKYKLISYNTNNNGIVAPSREEFSNIYNGFQNIFLGIGNFDSPTSGNKVHNYSLEIYFPNQDYNQNIDQNKEIKAYIEIENYNSKFIGYNQQKEVNHPVLFTGMTPVKWDDEHNEIETNEYDQEWYDYNNKKWANAKSADGSYWVWIPRYAYKITEGYHSSEIGLIDIKFLKGRTNENTSNTLIETEGYNPGVKDTSMYYFLHPAFRFNEEELGFWVAKYESAPAEGVATIVGTCNSGDNVTTKTVKIIPNANSWRCITHSNAFEVSLNMKNKSTYGWLSSELDTHMMKNTEWGAVTYLSKSSYGADNLEIWNNAFAQHLTGCSGTEEKGANELSCVSYNTENGVKASTTHNIYGIYDMSGGSWERVMGNYNDLPGLSGMDSSTVINTSSKYIDKYKTLPEGLLNEIGMNYDSVIYGDAIYETSNDASRYNGTSWEGKSVGSWNKNFSYLPNKSAPWFHRGGNHSNGTDAGLFFFADANGYIGVSGSFRPVLFSLK